jgi:hypothetical protein
MKQNTFYQPDGSFYVDYGSYDPDNCWFVINETQF